MHNKDELGNIITKGKNEIPEEADIRWQSVKSIQNRLDRVNKELQEFKDKYKINEPKMQALSSLCENYHLKIASIERLQNSYQGNKFASVVVDLDVLTCEIEKKFAEDFDSIFRM